LLADHQTTGGYPKIATVVYSDLDAFVQLLPRDHVGFLAVTPQHAIDTHMFGRHGPSRTAAR
ncbi:hypothetical protein AB9F40_34905, partial [Rhizobium leguminosarum]